MTALLEVRELTHRFGSVVVVDELSFDVAEGEALGIVGPNGAGKTTLLNLIAGDLRAQRGEIRFDGRAITDLPANARCRSGIGRTSQIPRPFTGLTAFENVLVGATFGAGKRADGGGREILAVDALERAGMTAKANVPASELTLLERKRLELARALATRPRLLLLDEIAGGLTDDEIDVLVATVLDIRASGVTIVWIEHVVHALLSVVDRIMAIDFGRLLIVGDPHEVMSSPAVRNVYLGEDVEPDLDRVAR
ncbi:MAG: ABC transporter ATP-binding protein [Acidimicrobiales bacterium]